MEIATSRPKEARLPIPGPSVALRSLNLVSVPTAPLALTVGWSFVTGFEELFQNIPAPETVAEAELIGIWMRVATETIRRTEEDCVDCIERKVFGQSKQRKRGVFVPGPPGIGSASNRLLLRVPHR